MPELPEVETVCRGLAPVLEGGRFKRVEMRRPDLRFPMPKDLPERLAGKRVERVRRRAKYILIEIEGGTILLLHLGMSGRIMVTPPDDPSPLPGKHDHLVFALSGGATVMFNDTRRFGVADLIEPGGESRHPLLATLGPEPLSNHFSGAILYDALRNRRSPIKTGLLDQKVVAGLGNIYVSEALFETGINPKRRCDRIGVDRMDRLAGEVRNVLNRAIAAGGSTLRDYAQVDGELGYFQHGFKVYDRDGEPCSKAECAGTIKRIVQSGRSTFYCSRCQR